MSQNKIPQPSMVRFVFEKYMKGAFKKWLSGKDK
jgi:hypothetical protein